MSILPGADLDHLKYESDEDEYSIPHRQGISAQGVATPKMIFSFPDKLKKETDPKVWETCVARALPILDELAPVCRNIASAERLPLEVTNAASRWLQDITDIRDRASRSNKTIIGVFGNTGDGKSSTINALLGEGSLLPTNCMRACTACVIELSYNHVADDENPYRAEIDFISRDAWLGEVTSVLTHLRTNNAIHVDDSENSDRDAAKFLAKVNAVYPGFDSKSLIDRGPENLVGLPEVDSVLGGTRALKSPSAEELRDIIAPYVDSHDKDGEDQIAYWPLVKAVRIYTKAKALDNGVTIVDLPGHQDWDAGRAAVASDYMKSCAGIWIVAPINRAVDNKTAKDLMGDHFKRQLHLDGSFSAVTVICSKTDDMTLESAVTNLKTKLGPETMQVWKKAKDLGRSIVTLELRLKSLGMKRARTHDPTEEHDAGRPAKRARASSCLGEGSAMNTSSSADAETDNQDAFPEIRGKQSNLETLRRQQDVALREVRYQCIQHRNEIARDAIRQYFANILRELNQQGAGAQQPVVGHANAQSADYEALSQQLPVFCTSSHVYQGMEGLLEGEQVSSSGFPELEDTQIPQLQNHAQKLTEELRISKHKEVLGGICRLLNSISIWTQNKPSQSLTLDAATLNNMLTELEWAVWTLRSLASSRAISTASTWAAPGYQGGLPCGTLRACFKRNGVWRGRNFNEEISEPFMSSILIAWDSLFRAEIPSVIDQFAVDVALKLKSFHSSVVSKLGRDDLEDAPVIETLNQQLRLYGQELARLTSLMRQNMDDAQREASRAFTPIIARWMTPGYQECLGIEGKNSVSRMQYAIESHVKRHNAAMFHSAVASIKTIVDRAEDDVRQLQDGRIRGINEVMKTDYTLALASREQSVRRIEEGFKTSMAVILKTAMRILK